MVYNCDDRLLARQGSRGCPGPGDDLKRDVLLDDWAHNCTVDVTLLEPLPQLLAARLVDFDKLYDHSLRAVGDNAVPGQALRDEWDDLRTPAGHGSSGRDLLPNHDEESVDTQTHRVLGSNELKKDVGGGLGPRRGAEEEKRAEQGKHVALPWDPVVRALRDEEEYRNSRPSG